MLFLRRPRDAWLTAPPRRSARSSTSGFPSRCSRTTRRPEPSCPSASSNWFDNGETDEFLQVTVAKPSGNGKVAVRGDPEPLDPDPGRVARGEGPEGRGPGHAGRPAHAVPLPVGGRARDAHGRWRRLTDAQRSWRPPPPLPWGGPVRLRGLEGVAVRQPRGQQWHTCHATAPCGTTSDRSPSSPSCDGRSTSTARRSSATSTSSGSARCRWRCGTWTTAPSRFARRVMQERTAGGTGRVEICVEAMEPATRRAPGRLVGRHLGDPRDADLSRCSWQGGRSSSPTGKRRSCMR